MDRAGGDLKCTHPRQIRRWLDGESGPPAHKLKMLVEEARYRVRAISAVLDDEITPSRQRAFLTAGLREGETS